MSNNMTQVFRYFLIGLTLFVPTMVAFAAPDLVVVDVWSLPSSLTAGQTFTFYAQIQNVGNSNTVFTSNVRFLIDGVPEGDTGCAALGAGQSATVSISAQAPAIGGSHTFSAIADIGNVIQESNEGNNTRQETWSVAGVGPDLVVSDIWTEPGILLNGQAGTFYATVWNIGNQDVALFDGFSTDFKIDGNTVGATSRLLGLDAGASLTVSCVFTSPATGLHTFSVVTDSGGAISETNETNNGRSESVTVFTGERLVLSTNALAYVYSPSQQVVTVWNGGTGVLVYTNSANREWISVSPVSGVSTGDVKAVTVSIDIAGLLIGSTGGTVSVASGVGTSNIAVMVAISDNDGDKIPDGWESHYFIDTANCNPNIDGDGDGLNNMEEWIAGTDPTTNASKFSVGSIGLTENGQNIRIAWTSLPGRLYDLLWAATMQDEFLPLGSDLPYTNNVYLDSIAPASGFYRLKVRLQ